jgi:hypothetical protein
MHVPGHQVDARQQAQRAMTSKIVVVCECLVLARLRRQIGRHVSDSLDTGLLVVRNDGHVSRRAFALLQQGNLVINTEYFGHLIAALETVAHLVRLDLLCSEHLADRALCEVR